VRRELRVDLDHPSDLLVAGDDDQLPVFVATVRPVEFPAEDVDMPLRVRVFDQGAVETVRGMSVPLAVDEAAFLVEEVGGVDGPVGELLHREEVLLHHLVESVAHRLSPIGWA